MDTLLPLCDNYNVYTCTSAAHRNSEPVGLLTGRGSAAGVAGQGRVVWDLMRCGLLHYEKRELYTALICSYALGHF